MLSDFVPVHVRSFLVQISSSQGREESKILHISDLVVVVSLLNWLLELFCILLVNLIGAINNFAGWRSRSSSDWLFDFGHRRGFKSLEAKPIENRHRRFVVLIVHRCSGCRRRRRRRRQALESRLQCPSSWPAYHSTACNFVTDSLHVLPWSSPSPPSSPDSRHRFSFLEYLANMIRKFNQFSSSILNHASLQCSRSPMGRLSHWIH